MAGEELRPAEARFKKHIEGLPCCWCGRAAPSVAHHQNFSTEGPSGLKLKHPFKMVPFCDECHGLWHTGRTLKGMLGMIAGEACENFLMRKMIDIMADFIEGLGEDVL